MQIQKATKEDLQDILTLQYLAYQSEAELLNNPNIPPLKQTIEDLQGEYNKGIILKALNEDGQIIGSVRAYCDSKTVFVGKLMVNPNNQGKGIGTKLLLAIESEFSNMRYELFTSTMSKKNIELYERVGYLKFNEKIITDELTFVYLEKLGGHFHE